MTVPSDSEIRLNHARMRLIDRANMVIGGVADLVIGTADTDGLRTVRIVVPGWLSSDSIAIGETVMVTWDGGSLSFPLMHRHVVREPERFTVLSGQVRIVG
jgi:hypothetical protein